MAAAAIAGLLAIAIIAASALVMVLSRRLRRRAGTPPIPSATARRATPAVPGEVIEVTATEVPAGPTTP